MSTLRKRILNDLSKYFREQSTGFPVELQEAGTKVNKRVRPFVDGVAKRYLTAENKERGKAELKHQLTKIPIAGTFFKPKVISKKPKDKATFTDVFLSRKEQAELKRIPSYFGVKEKKENPTKP